MGQILLFRSRFSILGQAPSVVTGFALSAHRVYGLRMCPKVPAGWQAVQI